MGNLLAVAIDYGQERKEGGLGGSGMWNAGRCSHRLGMPAV